MKSINPQISLGSWAFAFGPFEKQPWSFDRILQYASSAGYDGVEINGFRPHPHPDDYDTADKCRELVQTVQSYGLGISGYAPDFTMAPPALAEQGDYLREVEKCLAFCVNCGIRTLRVDTVSPPQDLAEEEYERRFTRLASTWHAAAVLAAQAGITIVWEFEPGFWLNKPSEVKRIVEAVGHPNFKVLFDTSHAYMSGVIGARHSGEKEILSGGIVEYARMLQGHIGHFHLIDSDGTLHHDETSTHTPFGQGYIDFAAFVREFKQVLSGIPWWCVDFCFHVETERDGKAAVEYIHSLLKEV